MNVRVTWSDIADGRKIDCSACPIALAVRRVADGFGARVYPWGIHVVTKTLDRSASYDVPPMVEQFIHDFDAGKQVQPFTFRLSPR